MNFIPERNRPPFHYHIVFIEPEIPPNTGSAGRLCVATQSTLHLIGKLGFSIDDKAVRRAGLDYWKYVDLVQHRDFDAWLKWRESHSPEMPFYLFEVGSQKSFYTQKIEKEAAFIFGRETTGISPDILAKYSNQHVTLPMFSNRIRSLNLSNTAALVLYEAIRQQGPFGD